jgi:hypothetical protein
MRANPGQVSFSDALQKVDVGKVLEAAAAGGVMGLTLGVGSAVLGTGFWATTYLGALGGGLGGQAGTLTRAAWDESVQMMNGAGFNGERFLNTALDYGFLDSLKWGTDCVAGGFAAGVGHSLSHFLGKWMNIPTSNDPNLMKEIVWVDLKNKTIGIHITDLNKVLKMPMSKFDAFMQLLIERGYDVSRGFLEELLQSGGAEWLEDQTG